MRSSGGEDGGVVYLDGDIEVGVRVGDGDGEFGFG